MTSSNPSTEQGDETLLRITTDFYDGRASYKSCPRLFWYLTMGIYVFPRLRMVVHNVQTTISPTYGNVPMCDSLHKPTTDGHTAIMSVLFSDGLVYFVVV
ncbi:hypothetical protein QCA50_004499 [Cerrena zonata]|uniref:Uncharacterized protein n=1 Tax=Cerrena zonata TaxID=2478898 RepID=A0AAW0GM10_9APHY